MDLDTNKLFENIFSHAHGGIAIVDLDGRWVKVNQSIIDLFGYSESEIYKLSFQDITHKDDLDLDLQNLHLLLEGKIEKYQIEKRYFHKDGHVILALLLVSLVRNKANSPLYFISQIIDISEQSNMNWQLNILMNIVKEQNKKLKDFAHIATHDIRTHVGNIGSITGFLEEEFKDLVSNENFVMLKLALENLEETLEHLNEIRKDKLEKKVELQILSLYDYVSHALYNVNALARKNNCQILNQVNHEFKVLATPAYLDSIILNFLTNAIKYKSADRNSVIKISTESQGEYIILKIQDNGLGIDLKKDMNKLFTLNGTLHKHKDSRGVGLFITKNHIESMGGKIEVESEVDKGTCFSIYLKNASITT